MSTFGLTYVDIEPLIDGFDLSGDAADVLVIITHWGSVWASLLRQEGIVAADVATTDDLYETSQLYVKMRTAASVQRSYTHQDPALANRRDAFADKLEKLIHERPEAFYESFHPDKQRGSWRSNRSLTRRAPGAVSSTRPRKKPWGEVF